MNPQNPGSFGAILGMAGKELKEAIMRRQGGGLNAAQVTSPAASGGEPPIPQQLPQTQTAQAAMPGAETPQPIQEDSDARIALKALAKVVTDESSLKKDLAKGRMQGLI